VRLAQDAYIYLICFINLTSILGMAVCTQMNNILNGGEYFESFWEPFEVIPYAVIHDAIGSDM
jgi:hypothetical protein